MSDTFKRLTAALADRYAVEQVLGAGGMATVYLARDVRHGRQVAVKVLRSELSETIGADRFLREIEIIARLTHPHILPLHDSGEADGLLYYVMPYVEGESLRARLNREPQLQLADALNVAREVADALSYAHAQQIVHRDIKPENILMHAGHVLVADFGIARAMTLSTVDHLTQTGTAIGTPAYMSPEQIRGELRLDHRTDIYALGCVLYEMLAGQPPFVGPTPESICRQHVSTKVPLLTSLRSTVPREVVEIVETALAKKAADRYRGAEDLAQDLNNQVMLATDPSRSVLRGRPVWRRWPVVGALAIVGAVSLVAAALGVFEIGGGSSASVVPVQRQVTFVGNVAEASVSPRGNFLAYTTTGPDGAVLMVQDLASGSAIEIVSSAGRVTLPSWSPDGREILVGGEASGEATLQVYPRLGGDPYAVPTTGGVAGRWSVDGRQMYLWSIDGHFFSLYTIATNSQMRIQTADTTAWLQDIAQHPGGDVLAVLHAARDGPENSIWLVSVDSVQRFEQTPRDPASSVGAERYELLLKEDARLFSIEWSPDGDALYYLRGDQGSYELWKLRTAQGRATRDPPELLLSGIELAGQSPRTWSSLLSLTDDGSRLFYVKGSTFSNLWSLRPRGDGWNIEQLTTGTATNLRASVSPDGEWVAYTSTVAGRTNVFVVPSEGGPSRQLTHVDSVSGDPVWSPDGKSLAFGLRRGGGNHVVTMNVAGAPSMRMFETTALSGNGTITWAPGSEILYQRPDVRNFHFLDPETEDERPLLSADSAAVGYALLARYSPDRTEVAVTRNRSRGEAGLYVISLAEGTHRRLATQPYVSLLGWSEDGRMVFVLSQDRRAVLAVPADGSTPTVLETLPFEAHRLGTTSNGRWFVLASSDATGDVWSVENFDPER